MKKISVILKKYLAARDRAAKLIQICITSSKRRPIQIISAMLYSSVESIPNLWSDEHDDLLISVHMSKTISIQYLW
jgi:hypothetical protein